MPLKVFVADLTFCDFLAGVVIASIYARAGFRIHQFQLLCDHQELASTPKGPPGQVSMKEMSFRNIYGRIH